MANKSISEPSVCIIVGCLATLRPLFSYFGYTCDMKSSRKTPVRYQQTRSRTRIQSTYKSSHGISNVFEPYALKRQKAYSSSFRRKHGFLRLQKAAKDSPRNEYELMANMEKGNGLFTNMVYDPQGRAANRASHYEHSN